MILEIQAVIEGSLVRRLLCDGRKFRCLLLLDREIGRRLDEGESA